MLLFNIDGRFSVGLTTLILPIRPTRQFGPSVYAANSINGSGPVLTLPEIAFSIYYPTKPNLAVGKRSWLHWLIRPIRDTALGLSHYSGRPYWRLVLIFFLYGAFLKIPLYSNVPLLEPVPFSDSHSEKEDSKWPLVIFSHGIAGSRTAYSNLCAKIASSGKVVVVMEHKDGTAPACYLRSETGSVVLKSYIHPKDTSYGAANQWDFRQDQLSLRRFEIYQMYSVLRRFIVDGDPNALQTLDGSSLDWSSFYGKVDTDEVQLVGHSFGSATVLSILSNPPPEEFACLPITHTLLLDPWLEPFPLPGPLPYVKDSSMKTTIINSEPFTLWKIHFNRLLDLSKEWNNGIQLYTIVRSIHMSPSDYPILLPKILQTGSPYMILQIIADMTIAFLDDRMDECISKLNTRKMEIEEFKPGSKAPPKKRLVGQLGDIVVH